MFFCNECGAITEGKERAEQIDGFFREYTVCDYCGSDDLIDAAQCNTCGKYYEPNGYDECDDCREKIYDGFYAMMLKIIDDADPCYVTYADAVEAMSSSFEDFYNKYRFL